MKDTAKKLLAIMLAAIMAVSACTVAASAEAADETHAFDLQPAETAEEDFSQTDMEEETQIPESEDDLIATGLGDETQAPEPTEEPMLAPPEFTDVSVKENGVELTWEVREGAFYRV